MQRHYIGVKSKFIELLSINNDLRLNNVSNDNETMNQLTEVGNIRSVNKGYQDRNSEQNALNQTELKKGNNTFKNVTKEKYKLNNNQKYFILHNNALFKFDRGEIKQLILISIR